MLPVIPTCFLVAIALSPTSARGDDRISIGGFAGGHIFSENLKLGAAETATVDSPRNGLTAGVSVSYALVPGLTIEGELAVMPTRGRRTDADLTIFAWRTHALVDLLPRSALRPFAVLGVGALTLAPGSTMHWEEDTSMAFHMGIGGEYSVANDWGLRVDLRSVFSSSTSSSWPATDFEFFAGFYRSFPESGTTLPPDQDGDGVFDDDDQCSTEPEDQDGFADEDGCPDLDNDLDGVEDSKDQCPADAETMNGIDDEDGCPDPDGDGDGFVGSRDACPRLAEDHKGPSDGCPELEQD